MYYSRHDADSPDFIASSPLGVNGGQSPCASSQPIAEPVMAQKIPASDISCGYPKPVCKHLQQLINGYGRENSRYHATLISIDNFFMILEAYDHDTTEKIMASLIGQLRAILAPDDAIFRLQKNLIGILHKDMPNEDIALQEKRIRSLISGFGGISDIGSLHLLSAIASCEITDQFGKAEALLDHLYIALTHLKDAERGIPVHHAQRAALYRQEMGLANYLTQAIEQNRLRMAYQPIIDSVSGSTSHYEALLRVIAADGSVSSAGALIPIAERMGMILHLDKIVLQKVVQELDQAPNLTLAYNVSNLTTGSEEWLGLLRGLVGDRPDIASRMIVEITETAIHRQLSKTAYFVAAIQELGAQVALDDFGAGYTSFRQLKALSVDMVKIDGAFIRDLVENADSHFFVRTLLEFTKGFGLKAVAEFVETGEVAKVLMELGVEYMQGYYFARPQLHRSWLEEDK